MDTSSGTEKPEKSTKWGNRLKEVAFYILRVCSIPIRVVAKPVVLAQKTWLPGTKPGHRVRAMFVSSFYA